MRNEGIAIISSLLFAMGLSGCDVDVEEKGKLPEVDVSVREGKMPDIDVRGPEVEVDSKRVEMRVPDVDVRLPRENDPDPNDKD